MRKVLILFVGLLLFGMSGCTYYDTAVDNNNISVNANITNNPIDSNTGSFNTITYAHHEVHAGSHYNYRDFYIIAKNSNKEFLIITPNTSKQAHTIFGFEATTSTIVVQLFENCTYSATGTIEPVKNRNRNFNDTNTVLLYENPTITTDGMEIASGIYGSGKNSAGDGGRDTEEIVLRENECYLLRITEQNIIATNVNILFDWYEHTPKN